MNDPRVNKLAQLLVNYSTRVKPGDLVAITALSPAAPLIQEVFREALRSGGYPYFLSRGYPPYVPGLENLGEILLKTGTDDQLSHVDKFYKEVVEDFDVLISIISDSNKRNVTNVDPSRISLLDRAHADATNTYFERLSSGKLRRVLTLFPTQAYAQDADMSLDEFEDYVFGTAYADVDDPIGQWQSMRKVQQNLVDWLNGRKKVEIKGKNVDLIMSIEGRTFLNAAGEINIPDGEIFTGPVEDSVNGWIRITYPDYWTGREIKGIELEFRDGRVERADAPKYANHLEEALNTDKGARYVGEFGIGTNGRVDRFIGEILFDEKIRGTIHIALGHGYPATGSKNESAIHWDLLCDMRDGGQVFVDDELFYESGEFIA
jgi:aminopeptidase